jgi:sugar lactone lactonase YvrE
MFYHLGMLSSLRICLSLSLSLLVTKDARWTQQGTTVAGGHGDGAGFQQFCRPRGLVVDDDDTVFVADWENHRIMAWKKGDNEGHVVAGGPEPGNGLHQLNLPTDVLIDKATNSLIISDCRNRRVVRWPLSNGTRGELLVDSICCYGLAMDKQGYLYVSDVEKHEVRRFQRADTKGTVVAGRNGEGGSLHQLNKPFYIFVDEEQSLYVSDFWNHRVMKWVKGAKEGIVVAGGKGHGEELTQLNGPYGVWVDDVDTVYVAEGNNHRITRWPKDETRGVVVVGGNTLGNAANKFNYPIGLSFDCRGNMYVADEYNHRVQQFKLEQNLLNF